MLVQNKWNDLIMKSLLCYAIGFLLISIALSPKVIAAEADFSLDKSQITIANKYADRFCSAKADHFFDGLDNEKTLKYSYFKYIGLQSEEMFSNDMYHNLINQIREKCLITKEEEKEINEFFQQVVE